MWYLLSDWKIYVSVISDTFSCLEEYCTTIIIKPGARGRRPRAPGFLKLLWFARRYVCMFVCPPPRPLITSCVIWCDIGRVRLVKQVLWLFPAFKMDGRGHFNTARRERLPKKTKVTCY